MTAGSDMASGRASLLTELGPRVNSARIARRVESAGAWNVRSSGADLLSIFLSITTFNTKAIYLVTDAEPRCGTMALTDGCELSTSREEKYAGRSAARCKGTRKY